MNTITSFIFSIFISYISCITLWSISFIICLITNTCITKPLNFSIVEENCSDYFQPDSGELILGDIILSVDRICSQAESYGHSRKREFAFLVAHSMLHLCGYDHETPEEAAVMEQKQETILSALGLTRDCLDE